MPDERVQQPSYLGIGKSLSEPAKQKERMTTIAELKERARLTFDELVAAEQERRIVPTIGNRLVADAASEKAIRETLRWAADRLREHVRTASYEGTRWILVHWFETLVKTLLEAEGLEPPEEASP